MNHDFERNKNTALVVVTHDTNLARSMGRVLTLEEGVLREWVGKGDRYFRSRP
jgi:ABC-type lipoprotein export system ATPase subunit